MPDARELKASREITEESGVTTTRLVFHADVTPDQLSTVTGLPALDDKLPWDDSQIAFSRFAVYEPGSVSTCRVYVVFSNSPPTWGGANPNDAFFKSWTLSYYETQIKLPYAFRNPIGYRYPSVNGQIVTVDSYDVESTLVWESRKRFIRRVRVPVFGIKQWELVGAQTNHLHKIGNFWYRFTVGDIQQISKNLWETSYTWEYDPGTPPTGIADTNTIRWPPPVTSVLYGGSEGYSRPPFESLYYDRNYDPGPPPVPGWPIPRRKLDHRIAQNGWTLLPGMSL